MKAQGAQGSDLAEFLRRASDELSDVETRLEMARLAAAGKEPALDRLDQQIEGLASEEEAQRRRAEKLVRSVIEDLERTIQGLRETGVKEDEEFFGHPKE
jgi:hypothetical protein